MLEVKKVIISADYSDFAYVFSKESAEELSKRFETNKHAINLEPGKQPPYGRKYSLEPVKLETLKTYIKTTLANNFIWASKSPAIAPILFV